MRNFFMNRPKRPASFPPYPRSHPPIWYQRNILNGHDLEQEEGMESHYDAAARAGQPIRETRGRWGLGEGNRTNEGWARGSPG